MAYSYEFKNNVLSRLLANELTISQASEVYGVSVTSLRNWQIKALWDAGAGINMMSRRTGVRVRMTRLKLPKGISYLKAYEAVTARHLLSDTDFGAYCRRNGILAGSVAE